MKGDHLISVPDEKPLFYDRLMVAHIGEQFFRVQHCDPAAPLIRRFLPSPRLQSLRRVKPEDRVHVRPVCFSGKFRPGMQERRHLREPLLRDPGPVRLTFPARCAVSSFIFPLLTQVLLSHIPYRGIKAHSSGTSRLSGDVLPVFSFSIFRRHAETASSSAASVTSFFSAARY